MSKQKYTYTVDGKEYHYSENFIKLEKMKGRIRSRYPNIALSCNGTTMGSTDKDSQRVQAAVIDLTCKKTGQFWMLVYPIVDYSVEGLQALENRFIKAIDFLLSN